MTNFMEAIVTIAALASAFAVYRLEKKHDALVAHVLNLEERLKLRSSNHDDDDD